MYFRFGTRAIWGMMPGLLLIQFQLGFLGGMELLPTAIFALASCSAMVTESFIAKKITKPDDGYEMGQAAYIRFAAFGAPLGTLSSAVQGVTVLLYFEAYSPDISWYLPYLVWWTGNLVGAYALVPLLTLKWVDLKRLKDRWNDFLVYSLLTVSIVIAISISTNDHLDQLLTLALILFLYFLIRLQQYAILVLCLSIGTLLFISLHVNQYTITNIGNNTNELLVLKGSLALILAMSMVIHHLVMAKADLARRARVDNENLQVEIRDRTKNLADVIKQREQAELSLRRSNSVLACIDALRDSFIKETNPFVMYGKFLDQFLRLTESEYGLVGDLFFDADGKPVIKMYAISNLAWNEPTRKLYDQLKHDGFEFRSMDNLIGVVVKSKAPVISNDAPHDSRGAGVPEGHPTINSFIGIPVFFGERMVGIVGLANRPGGFDQELLDAIKPVINALGQITVARQERQARDEAEEQIRHLALTDPLTDIANRRQYDIHFKHWAAESRRHQEPLFLLMMDIDHFKKINDQFGHDTGDKILVEFAQLTASLIRDSDLLARWGGEEFAVLLPRTDNKEAVSLGERIRSMIESHDFLGQHRVTVSIGAATLELNEKSELLAEHADQSLYNAKKQGRNRLVSHTRI